MGQVEPQADLSAAAVYTITSPKLPGVAPIYIQSDFDGWVARLNGQPIPADAGASKWLTVGKGRLYNTRIAGAKSIFSNSRQELVNGRVFDSQPKIADVLRVIKTWASSTGGYGLAFLDLATKATDAASLRTALAAVTPGNQLEKDALAALQNALAKAIKLTKGGADSRRAAFPVPTFPLP